jgi:hypothetical protein
MKKMIWSGQGPIYFGTFDAANGTPAMGFLTNLYQIGAANSLLTTTPTRETTTIKESNSGQRLDIAELETAKGLNVALTMHQFDRETLAKALFATSTLQAGGTVAEEELPTVADEGFAFLKHPNASSIVITDSAGSPVTLTADTHYRVVDAAQGIIQFLDISGGTQPFKAAYDYADYGNIAAFTATNVRTGIIFTGRNQDGDKARVIIPNLSLAMNGDFNWLSDEESQLAMQGVAFYTQELDTAGSLYGPFMRVDGLPD